MIQLLDAPVVTEETVPLLDIAIPHVERRSRFPPFS